MVVYMNKISGFVLFRAVGFIISYFDGLFIVSYFDGLLMVLCVCVHLTFYQTVVLLVLTYCFFSFSFCTGLGGSDIVICIVRVVSWSLHSGLASVVSFLLAVFCRSSLCYF